ncbi:hypothetical protein [Shewanella surugensis]|uniref:Multidrug effflux MFS transporter n=1 Tax=Shewanella surugensis TaxID=212020 RepID=A0ABT0L5G1_9GAMM|nr:hypothetical protein [Shewanella surugensis]MCL1122927.1 hypothetical protein [Shewanella surugensis]
MYIIGIFTFKKGIHLNALPTIRLFIVVIFLLGSILLSLSGSNLILSILALYIISFTIGFLNPMSSSFAMANITQGQGMAAALLTFSFALISSLYSFSQADLMLSNTQFTLVSLFTSFVFLLFIAVSLIRYKFD